MLIHITHVALGDFAIPFVCLRLSRPLLKTSYDPEEGSFVAH